MRELQRELVNREHNLLVIEETIKRDPSSNAKLSEVRDLLIRRILHLREQISRSSNIELAA